MWELLSAHRDNLQYLDIYRDDAKYIPSIVQPTLPNHLRGFKKLHTLRIQPRVLSGGIGGIIKAPFRFKNNRPTIITIAYPILLRMAGCKN